MAAASLPARLPRAARRRPPPAARVKKTRRKSAAGKGRSKRIDAPAYLQSLTSDLMPGPVSSIPLIGNEITFGSDPAQSMQALTDPSIAPRHARILLGEDGQYQIEDFDTVAGTWGNFDPVEHRGHLLKNGDVVHFGQL